MSADEITELAAAVAAMGALPMPVPVGPDAQAELALPWAHAMPDGDLSGFLDDLVSAALNRWRTDAGGPVPDRVTLADIERVCREWRTPGMGYRSDPEPVPSPSFAERAAAETDPARRTAWRMLAQDVADGEHYPFAHHDYRKGRDLELAQTGVQSPDRIVAYRNPDRPDVLLCREHGDGWWGLIPVTSEDLPDGGGCTYGDPADPGDVCGRDVLIDPKSGGTA